MSGRVYLHVGAPKTGTTFLQGVLWKNRDALAARGVYLPGERPNDHFRAGFDLRGLEQEPGDPRPGWTGAWDGMAARIRESAGDVAVVSDERLAACSVKEAERAVASLAPADVHVVYTVRSLGRLLPAEWQEHVKHRDTRTFDKWLADVLGGGRGWFWRVHDVADVLRRWRSAVPPDRIHVVTLPRPGSPQGLLWERFAAVLGIDADGMDTDTRANESLGLEGAEALRRVNESLPPTFPTWHHVQLAREVLAHRVLASRSSKTPIALPAEWAGWVREHTERLVADLGESGCHIVGDLADLDLDGKVEDPGPVRDSDVLAAAADGIAGLLTHMGDMRDEQRRLTRERDAALSRAAKAEAIVHEHQELPPVERIKRTAVELGGQWRLMRAALRVWRGVKALIPARP